MNNEFFNVPGADDLEIAPVGGRKETTVRPNHQTIPDCTAGEKLDCSKDFLDLLSTHFLICNDKIQGQGEDCGIESYTCQAGILGVFDGCGGLGSKTCPDISDKTEAYLASRAVGAAVLKWFYSNAETGCQWNADALKNLICFNLDLCRKQAGDESLKLRGSMIRPFPTTIAMIVLQIRKDQLLTRHIWAGDSRTYVLDREGLAQISTDDIRGEDAMANLSRDGALTNLLSADRNFALHSTDFIPTQPCILLSATDGCFSYVSSPMEFELMLLSTLIRSENVVQWQQRLSEEISRCAGDDQTLALASLGFEDFASLKNHYMDRCQTIQEIVDQFSAATEPEQQQLWQTYKPGYYRFAGK